MKTLTPALQPSQHLRRFLADESGEHAMETMMLLGLVVVPLILVVYMLTDILKEYVAYNQIFITSPFF